MKTNNEETLLNIFDQTYYINNNLDIDFTKTDPYAHYIKKGWKEFRNPSEQFNTWWYIINHMSSSPANKSPLEHYQESGQANNLSTSKNKNKKLSINKKIQYNTSCLELLKNINLTQKLAYRLAKSNEDLEQDDIAIMLYQKAWELDPGNEEVINNYCKILKKNKDWNKLLSISNLAIEKQKSNSNLYYAKAIAHKNLGNFIDASQNIKLAISLKKDQSSLNWHYTLAVCEEECGNHKKAEEIYSHLCNILSIPKHLGAGALHEEKSNWAKAASAYKKIIKQGIKNPETYYKYALMEEFSCNLKSALTAYQEAKKKNRTNKIIYYKIGCIYERLEQYNCAALEYEKACHLADYKIAEWQYRLGITLYKLGKAHAACLSFVNSKPCTEFFEKPDTSKIQSIKNSVKETQDPESYFKLGTYYFQKKKYAEAAAAFTQTVARRNTHKAADHYYLGMSLYNKKQYGMACNAFENIYILRSPFKTALENIGYDLKSEYAEYIKHLSVDNNVILYQSYHGSSFSCNPYAIFKHLISSKKYENFKHIIVVSNEAAIKRKYQSLSNVIFVQLHSSLYLRYLASAKYLINNTTFAPYFVRRKEQSYLNTWHGTPLKKLGNKISKKSFEYKNTTRNILQYTHLIYPNKHTLNSILKDNQAKDLYDGSSSFTGYPRIDLMLNSSEEEKNSILKEYGIDNGLPVLLYAPTWRGNIGNIQIDIDKTIKDIEHLKQLPINIVFKGHNFIQKKIQDTPLNSTIKIVKESTDINEFLSVTDILLTDYSSILFDFIPSKKPIILYTYDYKNYINDRGLYFDINSLPTTICQNINELETAIQDLLKNKLKNNFDYCSAIKKYCSKEDGNSTIRAVKYLFENIGADKTTTDNRKKIVFHAGPFTPNGLTLAFTNLVKNLPKECYSLNLSIDPWLMESFPERMQRFNEIPQCINTLPRISYPVATVEELYILKEYSNNAHTNSYIKRILTEVYKREFFRLYGESKIDVVIDYCGYIEYWSNLYALGRPSKTKGLLWLHNDMISDMKLRAPQLKNTLAICNNYDSIVSVSQSSHKVNQKKIAQIFGTQKEKFNYATNCISIENTIKLSAENVPSDIISWKKKSLLLGAVGRLSKEKGFDLLIKAFKLLNEERPDTKLIIIGKGPEEDILKNLINSLGLQDSVWIYGFIKNPYPVIKFLDLLIVSSRHEGLGMVILERLIMNKPVISTDIPGPMDIFSNNKDHLTKQTPLSIYHGIKKFSDGKLALINFNVEEYSKISIQKNLNIINQ